jgi:hypothetical protein
VNDIHKVLIKKDRDIHNQIKFITSLNKTRAEISQALPINNSFIRYDLLNLVMLYELEGKELTFKHIYSSINHSDIGIRNHVMQLQEGNWLKISESKKDARSKVISATCKLKKCYERLGNELKNDV